jgi:hypothetical protein
VSIYTRSTLGEPDNQIVFNDISTDPYIRVSARLPQKFQIRQEDIPVPYQGGTSDFLTLIGESTYVIEGTMYPRSQNSYDTGLASLRAVCDLDLNQNDSAATDEGYVPYMWGDALGSLDKQLFVKPLYLMAAESTQQGYVLPFKIVCKIKDPTIFGGTLKTASTAQANPTNTIGTFVLPTTLPAPVGVTEYSTTISANNIGLLPTNPVAITVYGPVTNPTVTNVLTGESITVNVTLSSSSDVLLIQYSKDNFTITKNGVNVAGLLTSNSVLFKIHPGTNNITLSGSLSTGAYCTVQYYDAWSLA